MILFDIGMNNKTSSRTNTLKKHLNGPAFVALKCLPACRNCFQRLKLTFSDCIKLQLDALYKIELQPTRQLLCATQI